MISKCTTGCPMVIPSTLRHRPQAAGLLVVGLCRSAKLIGRCWPCNDGRMTGSDPKADLRRYLQEARDALLWKLDGLTEYDIRRPLVPTVTHLLGLVKHLALVEQGYFGDTFGSPAADKIPWDEADPNSDMFAAPEESRAFITGLYRRACARSDAPIHAPPLDARRHAHWGAAGGNEVT